MNFLKQILVLGGLLSAFALSAQSDKGIINADFKKHLDYCLSKIPSAKRAHNDFSKAYRHYLEREDDSTILYSGRYLLNKTKDESLLDYSRYFRAIGFYNKRLFEDSEIELKKIKSTWPLYPIVISSRANILMNLGNQKEAIDLFIKLKKQDEISKFGIKESTIDHNMGVCYMFLGDYDESEKFLFMSLKSQEAKSDTANLIGTYNDIANLYYEQYRDDEAIPYFTKAYELAKQFEDYGLKQVTAGNMAVVEENQKNFEKSIAYRKEYDRWKDSTNNQNKVWKIAQLEKKYIAETKQREIGLLQRENDLKEEQQSWILIGAGVLLLVLVLIVYFYWQKIRSSAIISEQRESLDKLNAFKNRLFSIVSHDLRSSVNGLRRSTEQLRSEVPEENSNLKSLVNQQGAIANSTYGMLDNLLNWALLQSDEIYFHQEKVSLKRLLPQVVMNYQPLLDQKNIALEVDVPVEAKILADTDSTKIVLRNILDNAIKFTPEGGNIKISAIVEDGHCTVHIQDSGAGMTEEQLALVVEQSAQVSKESGEEGSGTGLGVRLCASFMLKNNGSFRMESGVGKGTTVILTFEKA